MTVAALPKRLAPRTGRGRCFCLGIMSSSRATSQSSRMPSKSASLTETVFAAIKEPTTVATKILSVTGSRTRPVGVSSWNRRAYQPSAISVTADMSNTAIASSGRELTAAKSAPKGMRDRLSNPGIRQRSRAASSAMVRCCRDRVRGPPRESIFRTPDECSSPLAFNLCMPHLQRSSEKSTAQWQRTEAQGLRALLGTDASGAIPLNSLPAAAVQPAICGLRVGRSKARGMQFTSAMGRNFHEVHRPCG